MNLCQADGIWREDRTEEDNRFHSKPLERDTSSSVVPANTPSSDSSGDVDLDRSMKESWTSLMDILNTLKKIEEPIRDDDNQDGNDLNSMHDGRSDGNLDGKHDGNDRGERDGKKGMIAAKAGEGAAAVMLVEKAEVSASGAGNAPSSSPKDESEVANIAVSELKSSLPPNCETTSTRMESGEPPKEEILATLASQRQSLAERTCSTCDREFASKKSRIRHQVSHSNDRPFSCEFCGKTFKLRVSGENELERDKDRRTQTEIQTYNRYVRYQY